MLPALTLPLLTAAALGQTTGVSHPDQDDSTAAAPAQTQTQPSRYVMPSKQQAAQPAAVQQQSYPATAQTPETSYPATGTAPAQDAAPTPALIVRRPLPSTSPRPEPTASGYAPPPAVQSQTAPATAANVDDGIVHVQLIPHQLNDGFVLKTRLDQPLSTETTVVGTEFTAQLLADTGHSGEVLLPAGSVIHGRVTQVHGGKRIHGTASIRLQAESVTLPDGLSYPLHATVSGVASEEDQHVNSEGAIQPNSHPKKTAIAIGAVTGAGTIMGAALGGGVGAGVGALVGAGAGTIFWLKQDSQTSVPQGTTLYFSLDEPLQLAAK